MLDLCDRCGEMKEGYVLDYGDYAVTRCKECFNKDKSFSPQACEVYSRVVGYLRPINQWNKGKRHEYSQRKNYANPIKNKGKI